MKIISTGAADILLVDDMPIGTSILDCEIVTNQSVIPYGKQLCIPDGHYKSFLNFKYIDLPGGYNYTVLNRVTELTEVQCKSILPDPEIVAEIDHVYRIEDIHGYKDFTDEENAFECPIDSFKSFLKSQGILLENPMEPVWEQTDANGRPYNKHFDYYSYVSAYNEAQSKVKNPLVIKAEKIT